jgi:lipoprotein-releasing system ATP-binding protein
MISLIKARKLRKSFMHGGSCIDILKGVDLDLNQGETISIVGASGIGKSTFLHILGTLDRPDSGNIWFKGKDVLLFDNDALAGFRNESIGFVFQFHYLLPEFTALENAMMPMLIKGINKNNASKAAEEILVRVGLKDRLSHKIVTLSGGEQQRVALARALILKPVILLADEPTGNLDKGNSDKIHELLLELNSELRMVLVIVTHNMELAAYMSKRVTIVEGRLVEMN